MSKTSKLLMEMYQAMRARFGHQHWWPGQTPLEICVGAILTQNTNWTNVEKAIRNLKDAGCMSVGALHAKPHAELAELIRPAGYFNIKARRLRNFIEAVWGRNGDDLDAFLGIQGGTGAPAHLREAGGHDAPGFLEIQRGTAANNAAVAPHNSVAPRDPAAPRPSKSVSSLREELLSINGIGRETADSIILYAAGKCTFVVDAYTCRILLRHFLIAPEDDYEAIKELMESSLPADAALWNDYHAQLVAVGKAFCRPTARCPGCPLEQFSHDADAGR